MHADILDEVPFLLLSLLLFPFLLLLSADLHPQN